MLTASAARFSSRSSTRPWLSIRSRWRSRGLAGRIHGEQMGQGVTIDFPDLLIGATALHLGFDVVTLNERHFQMIPGLKILSF